MRHLLASFLAVAMLLLASPGHAQIQDLRFAFNEAARISFSLYRAGDPAAKCTAWAFRAGGAGSLFFTAGHCVHYNIIHYSRTAQAQKDEPDIYIAVQNWPWLDVAIGTMPSRYERYPKIAAAQPQVGDLLVGVARTCGGTLKNLLFQYSGTAPYWLNVAGMGQAENLSRQCLFGYSGGPVLNQKNEVVGMFVALSPDQETAFYVPVDRLIAFASAVLGPADWPYGFGEGNP